MKYVPPLGSSDPNLGYVDGNPSAGVDGSPVPAAAIEHPLREIHNAIAGAGLTPDPANLSQLAQAIGAIANKVVSGAVDLSALINALNGKANKSGDTFSGNVYAPTAPAGTSSTQLASTAFVTAALAALGGSDPNSGVTLAQVNAAIAAALANLSNSYAPATAFVAGVGYGLEWPYTGPYGIRFTRANGTTVDVKIGDQSNPN